jgi:F-type H+-transporting ATPase subunit b
MLAIAAPEWIQWFDYPGLELWKFGNLAIFTIASILLLRRPISEALLARREVIRRELLQAQSDLDQAEAQLREAEALLARLNTDTAAVQAQAINEAEAERQRLAVATEREMEKLKLQAQREIEMAGRVARRTLRQYLASRSVELARETVRSQIKPEDDTHLIEQNIGQLRRTRA